MTVCIILCVCMVCVCVFRGVRINFECEVEYIDRICESNIIPVLDQPVVFAIESAISSHQHVDCQLRARAS